MMELYKKNKVNPASGCLPILLQIPIFFSLYKVIFVTIELRHAPIRYSDLIQTSVERLVPAVKLYHRSLNAACWTLSIGFNIKSSTLFLPVIISTLAIIPTSISCCLPSNSRLFLSVLMRTR